MCKVHSAARNWQMGNDSVLWHDQHCCSDKVRKDQSEKKRKDFLLRIVQGGSNMTGTDLCVNNPHCAAAVRP